MDTKSEHSSCLLDWRSHFYVVEFYENRIYLKKKFFILENKKERFSKETQPRLWINLYSITL